MKRASLGSTLLPLVVLASSCIDERGNNVSAFFNAQTTSIAFAQSGDDVVMRVKANLQVSSFGDGTILIDSAAMVATVGAQTVVFDDPNVETEDFPLIDEIDFIEAGVTLEVPSPIFDLDTLEASCVANGRTLDVTVRLYATQNDRREADEPPLTTTLITLPLVTTKQPPPPNVFGTTGALTLPTIGLAAPIPLVVPGSDDDILFVTELAPATPGSFSGGVYQVYRADRDSAQGITQSNGELFQIPRIVSTADGGLILGGRGNAGQPVVLLFGFDDEDVATTAGTIEVDSVVGADVDALQLAGLFRSANGYVALIESSYPLMGPEGAVAPEPDKLYGSFVVEIDEGLTVLSVRSADRDITHLQLLPDGTSLRVSTDLPPRSASPTLRIERLDIVGDPIWTHEENALTFQPVVRATSDGGAVIAYEPDQGGVVTFLKLNGEDGTVDFLFGSPGAEPSAAVLPDGGAILTFVGTSPQLENVPPRSVPVLVEMGPRGELVRSAQLACGGWAQLANAADGRPMFVGAFQERFTLGDAITDVTEGELTIADVE